MSPGSTPARYVAATSPCDITMLDNGDLSHDLWSRLPLELIREILFMVALLDDSMARQLRLVSQDVNVLVLPILFRHVIMVLPEHVSRFTATLLPKRKNYIPALKSKLHLLPRPLSSYHVDTWVMVINDQRPSIETALANIGPVFTGLSKLVISGQNLSSNAFWLRQHAIHPTDMMIVHHGSPHLVNFYDPIFRRVTHLYTSITHGHRYSSVSDIPRLTHLAVHTRPDLPDNTATKVATSLHTILNSCERLEMLVLTMSGLELSDDRKLAWSRWLEKCLADSRFVFLPFPRDLRVEWGSIIRGQATVWDRAKSWQMQAIVREDEDVKIPPRLYFGDHWEIDLVQRDDYEPPEDPEAESEKSFHLGQL